MPHAHVSTTSDRPRKSMASARLSARQHKSSTMPPRLTSRGRCREAPQRALPLSSVLELTRAEVGRQRCSPATCRRGSHARTHTARNRSTASRPLAGPSRPGTWGPLYRAAASNNRCAKDHSCPIPAPFGVGGGSSGGISSVAGCIGGSYGGGKASRFNNKK